MKTKGNSKPAFDLKVFLSQASSERTMVDSGKNDVIFTIKRLFQNGDEPVLEPLQVEGGDAAQLRASVHSVLSKVTA